MGCWSWGCDAAQADSARSATQRPALEREVRGFIVAAESSPQSLTSRAIAAPRRTPGPAARGALSARACPATITWAQRPNPQAERRALESELHAGRERDHQVDLAHLVLRAPAGQDGLRVARGVVLA